MKRLVTLSLMIGVVVLLSASIANAAACPAQPSNADGTTIASPAPDATVGSTFTVSGDYFGSFEGVVPIRVLDAGGAVLVDTHAMNECCKLDPYSQQITLSVSAPKEVCVVVYRESGADGSLTPLAQVPVTVGPARLPNTGETALPFGVAVVLAALIIVAGYIVRRKLGANE